MSSALDENDYDPEASVSSINSDSEKVDSSLIKRILSEMKSEFNRGTADNSEDFNENEEMSELLEDGVVLNKEPKEDLPNEHTSDAEDPDEDNEQEQAEEECVNEPIVINKAIFDAEEDGSEQKPRLILTLRTTEESREMGGRLSRRSLISHNSSDRSFSDVSDSSFVERRDVDEKGSKWESRSRRLLRSSSRVTDRDIENSGLKRSSRRFSKEQCRESVLQSAILRKEKSFSSMNLSEERTTRRGARSPRQSPSDQRPPVRHCTRSRSEQGDGFDSNMLLAIKTETDFNLSMAKSEHSDDSNDTLNLNSTSTNSQTSEPPSDVKPLKTDKLYTKTGKRRTKYYKGLKYSLTTGGSVVRKKALSLGRKGRKKIEDANVSQSQSANSLDNNLKLERNTVDCENSEGENDDKANDNAESQLNMCDLENKNDDNQSEVSFSSKTFDKEEDSIGENPTLVQAAANKRKYPSDSEECESEKRCRSELPSPLQGDAEAEPDKPEATAISIGVGTAGVCKCNSQESIYAKSARTELYCQAVDSLDGRLIGCCNSVKTDEARLSRPSTRVPFLVLCDVHYNRLQRHNCCPGCGVFCMQGQFVQCWAYHLYHRDCQLVDGDKKACPHCGSEDAYDVNISLGAHKYPVLFPLQMPPRKMPTARMTFSYASYVAAAGEDGEADLDPNLPLVPSSCLTLPSGEQLTSDGMPQPMDKDKLARLLHVRRSIDPLCPPRYTVRNVYQAAKHGDCDKLYLTLAAGLNPNHQFREWGMGSALHAACHGGHLGAVHMLVQAGANKDVMDRELNTPLMVACDNGHNTLVKYLVKAGADVTLKGADGMTALHLAAKAGNVEACHHLLSNPNLPYGYINTVDDGRWTPLVWAAEHKHCNVVKYLLKRRADPLVRDAEQNIALHWAALSGSVDIADVLLDYESDVNSTNAHADTPLHIAARQNAYDCVTLLLARGARVDIHNRAGFVPLDCVTGAPNETYLAIKLNVELRNTTLNLQRRKERILTLDITNGSEAIRVPCVNSVDDESEPQDFTYVAENCFTSQITVDRTITSLQSCKCRDMCMTTGCMCGKLSMQCWYDDEGKLLPEFNFADPSMLFECNPGCACNKLICKNRVVQRGITASFQLFRTKGNKGWGLRTLRLIPKGAYVCEYVGEIISDCEADTREDDAYLFDLDNRDGETYCIDARRYGNIARFINHSCQPNLLPVRVFIGHQDMHFPRIAFFASRDILAKEELGFDYGEKFWIIKAKLFTCTCGAELCRYSETTINKTLRDYNRRLKNEEN